VATPITDVREISRIGYGFRASRALFAALDADVFGRLADGPKPLAALWLLNAVTIDTDVAALTPAWLATAARRAGFDDPRIMPVVPGTTRLLSAWR
jgi:hypothetical protein